MRGRLFVALVSIVMLLAVPAPAHAACEGAVCIDDESAKWTPDATLSLKQQGKEYKKNRKRKRIAVTVTIEGGRGSAFIDGRYTRLGESIELAPGRHELHVRDGDTVLAQGVLTVPRTSDGLQVAVRHP